MQLASFCFWHVWLISWSFYRPETQIKDWYQFGFWAIAWASSIKTNTQEENNFSKLFSSGVVAKTWDQIKYEEKLVVKCAQHVPLYVLNYICGDWSTNCISISILIYVIYLLGQIHLNSGLAHPRLSLTFKTIIYTPISFCLNNSSSNLGIEQFGIPASKIVGKTQILYPNFECNSRSHFIEKSAVIFFKLRGSTAMSKFPAFQSPANNNVIWVGASGSFAPKPSYG